MSRQESWKEDGYKFSNTLEKVKKDLKSDR